jgi:cell division protein FtsB
MKDKESWIDGYKKGLTESVELGLFRAIDHDLASRQAATIADLQQQNKELAYDRAHMDSLRKENAELYGKNKELREALVNVMAEYENGGDYLLAFNAARKLLTLSGGG